MCGRATLYGFQNILQKGAGGGRHVHASQGSPPAWSLAGTLIAHCPERLIPCNTVLMSAQEPWSSSLVL